MKLLIAPQLMFRNLADQPAMVKRIDIETTRDAREQPGVTDFGLARTIAQDSGLTQTGAVMGTPSYVPPEQATGRTCEISPPSDGYALGGILYRFLTGRPHGRPLLFWKHDGRSPKLSLFRLNRFTQNSMTA